MKRLLLALQYWNGDKEDAGEVASIIAGLESKHREDTDFLLVCRYDSDIDPKVVKAVSSKFGVYTHRCPRRGIGWPAGCNDLWYGTVDFVHQSIGCKKMPAYDAMLTFEADALPLVPDWISRMREDWDKARAFVAGALLKAPVLHINGNALFSCAPSFLQRVLSVSCPVHYGWDAYLSTLFRSFGWKNLSGFRSEWQRKSISEIELLKAVVEGVYFHHGIKDASVKKFVRKKYLTRLPLLQTV